MREGWRGRAQGGVETSIGNWRHLSREGGGGDLPTFQSQDDRQVKQPLLYYRGESNRTNQSLDVKRLFVFFLHPLQVEIPIALRWGTRGSQF